jgi:histidinol dehydrogenase
MTGATTPRRPDTASTDGVFAVMGELARLSPAERARLFDRGRATDPDVRATVRGLIDDVRARGDAALRDMARRFDNADLATLEVPRTACERALAQLDPDVRHALQLAADNIAAFHRAQLPRDLEIEVLPGVRLGRRAEPLARVGVYAPGGRASYPSSVLMGVVPAKVAGVTEVVVCSPPGPDGLPPAAVLAACALAGADRVFAVGGAGAIAALAIGTASVPRVDRIVGPGNAYVTEAKQQLTGSVAIDSPAGPSEVLVLADDTADARLVAAELLAQAEHDPDAAAVLVTTAAHLIDEVARVTAHLLDAEPRADVVRAALRSRGALLLAANLDDACAFANEYAAEHVIVMTQTPRALLPRLRAAGTMFLGAPSSVAFGDYITGANHVLPTGGMARSYSGLSTADFLRFATYQELTGEAAAALAGAVVALATAEGLPAHARAANLRAAPPAAGADVVAGVMRRRAVRTRGDYAAITPYDPGRLPCAVDLSDNTNLFGPAPSVRVTLAALPDATITRYPTVYATELRAELASRCGVEPSCISTGCGSDDVIDAVIRAFCEPGDRVAYPDPTFGMIPTFARMNAAAPVPVPLRADMSLDVTALLAARSQLIYVCSPNNPTGSSFARADVAALCHGARGLVLIDEAYADFADDDLLELALASDNVIVLRTLSKAYGLAGLRVGYAAGNAALIAEIQKARGPYKVNGPGEAIACAVLRNDGRWVADRIAEVRTNRARLEAELRLRGVAFLDSAANFLLLSVTGTAQEWNGQLRRRGVAVRPFSLPGGEYLRVSIGPWHMLEAFLAAFDAIRNDSGE